MNLYETLQSEFLIISLCPLVKSIRKASDRIFISFRPSVLKNYSTNTGRIFIKFYMGEFYGTSPMPTQQKFMTTSHASLSVSG
jgi:hypothetical protein